MIRLSAFFLFGAKAGERAEPRLMTQCEFLYSSMRDAEHGYALGRASYYRERWTQAKRNFKKHRG